jgi:hypothetical protein
VGAALAKDVVSYLYVNALRERVRAFVRSAISRLAAREDVAAIVVNAHSQGSVIAFDVLRSLPAFATAKLRGFVTAGSPLRKYVTLFRWGADAATIGQAPVEWLNLWDRRDLVADPLAPSATWLRGRPLPAPGHLLFATDPETGHTAPVLVRDAQVDNAAHAPASPYPAHDYWENRAECVPAIAALLRRAAEEGRETVS